MIRENGSAPAPTNDTPPTWDDPDGRPAAWNAFGEAPQDGAA